MAEKRDIKVRVLVALELDGVQYRPDDVATLPAAIVAALKNDAAVDDDKNAVAYALSVGGK